MSKQRKPQEVTPKPDDLEDGVEEDLEELAATFGAGPKAAPPPKGPMEGQQYAP